MPSATATVKCPECGKWLGETTADIKVACHGWTIHYTRKSP